LCQINAAGHSEVAGGNKVTWWRHWPLDKWHDVVGEPTFADAILDRIVHNAYRLELDGPSMRKLKANDQTEPEARPSTKEAVGSVSAPTKPAKGGQR
jgi:hypothetical protein